MICENEGGHGLNDGDGAGKHTGIVAAFTLEFGVYAVARYRLLAGHDGGGGLEGDAEADVFAIADAALDAAGAIAGGADASVFHDEGIVVFASGEERAGEA